jgi:hypothetical protein
MPYGLVNKKLPDSEQSHLFNSGETLDKRLSPQGLYSGRILFAVNQLHRIAIAGVAATLAAIMLLNSTPEIIGDAGVEGLITALDNVDKPWHILQDS